MNDLACMQAFVAIVEEGSQAAAAKKLCQTSAAINKKLVKLEQKLGTSLLIRNNKGSRLTEMGERYFAAYQDILARIEHTESLALSQKEKPKGRLLISASQAIIHFFLLPKINAFMENYPGIFMVFDVGDKSVNFVPQANDILIAPDLMIHDTLVRKRVFSSRNLLCASPNYLKKVGQPKTPNDLRKLSFIGHCLQATQSSLQLGRKLVDVGLPSIRVNDHETALDFALAELGFFETSEYKIKHYLDRGELVELLPEFAQETHHYAIHYQYQEYLDPRIRAFVDFFTSNE